MINIRKEGECCKYGINYIRTKYGHGVLLYIPLHFIKVRVGYYWGKKFNPKFEVITPAMEQASREFG